MKYRSHRGGLDESMATMIEIPNTIDALYDHLSGIYSEHFPPFTKDDITLTYCMFDHRVGWDTYYVSIKGNCVGMSDGPLQEEKK